MIQVEGCWWYPGSTVVEHTTHNPEIQGSNPATGTGREIGKIVSGFWSISVVIQDYELHVHHSHVIRGNDLLFKCDIPSFVTDLVTLFNWEDSDQTVYQASSAANYGKTISCSVLWPIL